MTFLSVSSQLAHFSYIFTCQSISETYATLPRLLMQHRLMSNSFY